MKKMIVQFPIIGWAEVEIEVEDDALPEDVEDAILNDELEVEWNGQDHQGLIPLFNLRDWKDYQRNSEIPDRLEVVE